MIQGQPSAFVGRHQLERRTAHDLGPDAETLGDAAHETGLTGAELARQADALTAALLEVFGLAPADARRLQDVPMDDLIEANRKVRGRFSPTTRPLPSNCTDRMPTGPRSANG